MGSLLRLWFTVAAVAIGALWGLSASLWQSGALVVLLGALLIGHRRNHGLRLGGVLLVSAGLVGAVAVIRLNDGEALKSIASDVPRCEFSGHVREQAGALGTVFVAEQLRCLEHGGVSGVVMIDGVDRAPAGALIDGTGWLLPLSDEGFDLARRRLGAAAVLDPIDQTTRPPESVVLRVAARLRSGLTSATHTVSPRSGALLAGLTIGDTSGFDESTTEAFRRTGLAHLLAVSGSNVAMVLVSVAWLSRRLSYRVRLALGCLALALFVLIVGPDPSVLRAALMGCIGMFALGWVRRVDPLHSLGLALLVIFCARPAMVTSIGLHLSAAATLGIVLWAGSLARRLGFLPEMLAIPLGLTLAAQLAVAPILIATFGDVSLIAPLTNLLVSPAVWLATLGGLSAAVVSPFSDVLAGLIVRCVGPALGWILMVADHASELSWASVSLAPVVAAGLGAVLATATLMTVRGRFRHAS